MKASLLLIPAFLFTGCSLKYGTTYQDEANVPEFVFSDAVYSRYEDNSLTTQLSASRLEQYGDGKSMYAKDVDFKVQEKDGTVKTEGSCGLLSSNSEDKKYALYDDIKIYNKNDDMLVTADTLKWDGKSEQLVSSRNDMVSIKKGGTVLHGSGFSASGVSKKFSFTGVVTGEYNSDEKSDENPQTDSEREVEDEQ